MKIVPRVGRRVVLKLLAFVPVQAYSFAVITAPDGEWLTAQQFVDAPLGKWEPISRHPDIERDLIYCRRVR